jgi:hypothetical protein
MSSFGSCKISILAIEQSILPYSLQFFEMHSLFKSNACLNI